MQQRGTRSSDTLEFGAIVTIRCSISDQQHLACSDGINIRGVFGLALHDNTYETATCLFRLVPPLKFQFGE